MRYIVTSAIKVPPIDVLHHIYMKNDTYPSYPSSCWPCSRYSWVYPGELQMLWPLARCRHAFHHPAINKEIKNRGNTFAWIHYLELKTKQNKTKQNKSKNNFGVLCWPPVKLYYCKQDVSCLLCSYSSRRTNEEHSKTSFQLKSCSDRPILFANCSVVRRSFTLRTFCRSCKWNKEDIFMLQIFNNLANPFKGILHIFLIR